MVVPPNQVRYSFEKRKRTNMTWTKEMPANPVVAVAGATGAVGQEFLRVLHDVDFPASEVRALASARSAGKKVPFEGCGLVPAGELTVQEMTPESFEGVDIALFSAGASVSKEMREAVTAAGAVMIDNSSAFRPHATLPNPLMAILFPAMSIPLVASICFTK